jgi:hypothetical protein
LSRSRVLGQALYQEKFEAVKFGDHTSCRVFTIFQSSSNTFKNEVIRSSIDIACVSHGGIRPLRLRRLILGAYYLPKQVTTMIEWTVADWKNCDSQLN